ncbi:hypothetical protein ES319_D03G199400v1 [Gossypium barbadense]|uniref:BZIP domain-containing protein n=2 Tax=Gossypium TaxID=3633 RepID=A0A5J5S6H5_GOSBA|nr:hypothetical protein ES319_D03G199400v1 [Gossypium barbadense]PPD80750.1 hypothetical protein GOBAR_DD22315 [Gossypium barbadense]TYG77671.1 hypothetical protein ES288_D03G213500v1 [Gossypium darwinii]
MEDELNMNPSGAQGTLVTNSSTKSYNDIMTRRLKNRERQRRYRARKRLEADMQKSHVLNQPTIPNAELQLNGILNNVTKRVHCKRDWKKDARRAHIYKAQEGSISTVETQASCLPSVDPIGRECSSEDSPNLQNYETRKPKLGRRDWKADARNKKS